MSKKRKPAEKDAEIDDSDDWENEDDESAEFIPEDDLPASADESRQRDWRDLERYKEDRDLRRQLEDDLWSDD